MINKKVGLISGAVGVVALAAIGATFATGGEPKEQSQTVADADAQSITVYKNENCSCCKSWAEHLEKNGFQVDLVVTTNMSDVKKKYGVPREMHSCHTAVMSDVVIEGHVPADDIKAYLEKPVFNTKGLAVPGMVQGSPGMETGRKDDYSVIAFSENGKTSVFREHKDY